MINTRRISFLCLGLCLFSKSQANREGGISIPAPAHYYPHQLVDHLSPGKQESRYHGKEWSQRYYVLSEHFQGPGSPIFLIFGGEGAIEPSTGIYYPFVGHHLAKSLGAFVLQPEHRFYGFSQPLVQLAKDIQPGVRGGALGADPQTHEDPRVQLFTSEQALMDAVRLVQHIAEDELKCSLDRSSPKYCPVIAVGGSYPGFLSAMARVNFPNVIDISYAASAPMKFYSQEVGQGDYYNHITKVAEATIPGCSNAVKDALNTVYQGDSSHSDYIPALEVGICPGTLPSYIQDRETFFQEVFMMAGYTFANDNMWNYPPSSNTRLYEDCQIFLSNELTAIQKLKKFLVERLGVSASDCFDMSFQLPTGPNATISGGDWSGDGVGANGESWDFQTCTLLVEKIGFSEESMFPRREWTLDWMERHCQARFGVTPRPMELVQKWKFNDLVSINASRILFTNGMNDGWSVGAVKHNLSEGILALNFENGAHHSDLNPVGPREEDTDDIKEGYIIIQNMLSKWLDEVRRTVVAPEGTSPQVTS